MIKTLTSLQAKLFDKIFKERFGISTLILMENAGRAVAEEVLRTLKNKRRVAIFCGKGNNGGDGFVCARHLLSYGIRPDIFLTGKIKEVKNEARINLDILIRLKQKVIEIDKKSLEIIKKKISKYDLIIDAIFGIGLKGQIDGFLKDLIEIINFSKVYILSVDIPSGLDADRGKILGCCVKADKTITFLAKKLGMTEGFGRKYCGRILVKDLGVPLREPGTFSG